MRITAITTMVLMTSAANGESGDDAREHKLTVCMELVPTLRATIGHAQKIASSMFAPVGVMIAWRGGFRGCLAWDSVRNFSHVILVEGLFDVAVLWQAGFRNTTCAIGTHLSSAHLAQLSDAPGRCVYIVFDRDDNQAGQRAAHQLALQLKDLGLRARIVHLPQGQDPNSYFVAGATAADFITSWERAQQV